MNVTLDGINTPGTISPYEEHLARRKAGYTIPEWRAMMPEDRSIEVALYRIENMMEYAKHKAEERLMKRKQR